MDFWLSEAVGLDLNDTLIVVMAIIPQGSSQLYIYYYWILVNVLYCEVGR